MKKLTIFASAVLLMVTIATMTTTASALEQGAYSVYAGSNYWNPDTGEVDDGGTANAALGDGMSRSVTGTSALVEREGDSYFVTVRLLLQSSTYDAQFQIRTDYNTYEGVEYDIMAENAVTDSVDYRFQVDDPFQPIKASMYVVPMGRTTVWYIQLDESSTSSDTGDFIVTVQPLDVQETEEVEETQPEILVETTEEIEVQVEETPEEEIISQAVDTPQEDENHQEDVPQVEQEQEVEAQPEEAEMPAPESETADEGQPEQNFGVSIGAVVLAVLAVVVVAGILGRKRANR